MDQLGPARLLLTKAVVGLVTVTLGTLAVAVGVVSQRGAARIVHLWGRILLVLIGVRVTVEGLDRLDLGRRYVIMANHESSLDIPALLAALPAALEVRFLARKDLFGVPFLGWAMSSAGFVPVDRDDRSTAPAMFARTLDGVRRGGSPLIFPEQTFTPDGRLLPFARGGFLVALKAGLPILPVGLEGPRLVMPPGEGVVRPRPVAVRIGEPIATAELRVSAIRDLMARTRADIDRLRGAAGHFPD
ncbi:MAG TPA: lysophospholipid acyltransferase family protein [Candidatus Sulfomarinibacteraceae bacterium]|nr:lysophospholipid acyltransferase family protein [Candidatus Sulfomarinibacteraceae bacterium]